MSAFLLDEAGIRRTGLRRPSTKTAGVVYPKYQGVVITYRHTQPGTLILIVCLIIGVFGVDLSWMGGDWKPAIVTIVITAAVGLLFASLTVEVNDGELRWYFGPGLWSYRLPLAEIRDVGIVRNH
jgi:uncharacterized integral membrane protein